MRWDRNSVREGMFVTSTKGERIGKVIRRDDDTFVVEKGTLFPKDYELRYDHIAGLNGGEITYALGDTAEREERGARRETAETRKTTASLASDAPIATASTATAATNGPRSVATTPAPAGAPTAARAAAPNVSTGRDEPTDNEVRIPLMQEELEIEKVPRESGHVRIHKGVKTEERHFTVPVRREEIVIEHVTAFAGGAGTGEQGTFEERIVDIPLHEEDIRVSKRPVLREEIVVRTVAHSVEKEATATLRHEEADVEDTRKATAASDEARPAEARSGEMGREEGYGAPGRR